MHPFKLHSIVFFMFILMIVYMILTPPHDGVAFSVVLNPIRILVLTDKHIPIQLPSNYNFEIKKTIWQIRKANAKHIALQFPEGLLMYSLVISDIIQEFTGADTFVMGDVTYGACCIDDYTASSLGADFMVHYGHSCLIPVNITSIKTLYVFVEISIDTRHFIDTIHANFEHGTPLILVGTIQFMSALQASKKQLEAHYPTTIPQSRPLSPGEILGCTSPSNLCPPNSNATVIYLGDGRFHLESIMIANPSLDAFKYDPYVKKLTREVYDHVTMRQMRADAIRVFEKADHVGIVLGTLGRQGNTRVLETLQTLTTASQKTPITYLLSEITPAKLSLIQNIQGWIQTSCPRLSIDWGAAFMTDEIGCLVSPYEAAVAFGKAEARWRPAGEQGKEKMEESVYPMDFYAKESTGPWTPNWVDPALKRVNAGGRRHLLKK